MFSLGIHIMTFDLMLRNSKWVRERVSKDNNVKNTLLKEMLQQNWSFETLMTRVAADISGTTRRTKKRKYEEDEDESDEVYH